MLTCCRRNSLAVEGYAKPDFGGHTNVVKYI